MICVIPARYNSVRLPGKMMRPFCGHPLLRWTIDQARAHFILRDIHVVTDSPEVDAYARDFGLVPRREPELLLTSALNAVRLIGRTQPERMLLLQPTFPLRTLDYMERFIRFAESNNFNLRTVRGGYPTGNMYAVHSLDLAAGWVDLWDADEGVDINTQEDFAGAESLMAARLAKAAV